MRSLFSGKETNSEKGEGYLLRKSIFLFENKDWNSNYLKITLKYFLLIYTLWFRHVAY